MGAFVIWSVTFNYVIDASVAVVLRDTASSSSGTELTLELAWDYLLDCCDEEAVSENNIPVKQESMSKPSTA